MCCLTATVAVTSPSEKHFFFVCILGVVPHLGAYSIQVNKKVFYWKTLQITLDIHLILLSIVIQFSSVDSVSCFLQSNCLRICVGFNCFGHEII